LGLYYTMEWFWVQGVIRCPGPVFVTQEAATTGCQQAGRTTYYLRGEECEDVNHLGEGGPLDGRGPGQQLP